MIIVFDKNRRYATLLLRIKVNVYIDSKRKEIKKDIKENYRGYLGWKVQDQHCFGL